MSDLDSNGILVPTGTSQTAFYNANRDQPVDPTVPAMIEDTRGLVETFLDLNKTFAQDAYTTAQQTIEQLRDVKFPEDLPDPPAEPAINTSFSAMVTVGFDQTPDLGTLTNEAPAAFTVADITVPNIEADLPDYVPIITGINIPDAPALTTFEQPTAPDIDLTLALPDAPTRDYGVAPDLVEIRLPTYVAPVIPLFGEEAPTFTAALPDPFINWTEPVYASTMKDAVAAVIEDMLAGGTGLPAAVSQAIWDRARGREETTALKAIDEAIGGWAAKGFAFPIGVLNALLIQTGEDTQRKVNELSRERAIADADLEQKNRQFAVEKALDFERIFTAIFLAIVDRNFQIAKFGVETQINLYNLAVTAFNVQRQVWQSKIEKYRVDLDAAFAELKGFEAQVNAERVKSEVNKSLVDVYDSKVKAYATQVSAYEALVRGVTAQAELQKNKVEVYKGQVDAMVGLINGERAKFEAYDSHVKGETAKIGLEEANARAYSARAQALGIKADIIIKRVDAQIAGNKQTLDWNIANMTRITQRGEQDLRGVQARLAAFQAVTSRGTAKYEADRSAKNAELAAQVSLAQVAIARYSALLEQWKTRTQEIIQLVTLQAESVRAAGTMASNLAAGAMAGTHVSAGLSASTGASTSASRSSSDSTSQSRSVAENSNYSVNHNFQHRV